MKNWFVRFPTILQACESMIEMLRGQYSHYVGCYHEATFHYIEAAKVFVRSRKFSFHDRDTAQEVYGLLLVSNFVKSLA